jgi:tetratricopeptide (TPR) repeat protein
VCRTALPDSQIATNASREIGKLVDANEPRRAALYWEQILLHALNTTAPFTEAEGFPLLATQVIHKARAQAAIAEGNAAAVGAELSSSEKILPADVRLTVELIPELRRAGMTEQADGLFERALVLHRQVIQEHPMSATYLNNAAWICGRGQRELEQGLEFALKAVELMPNEAAYQDTLAEIYFQRGEREQAVAAATKCLEIAPANKMFATRLAHFRNDELKTLDKDPE